MNNVRAWVYRVARNLHIDTRRELERYRAGGQEPERSQTTAMDPEQHVLELERIRIVEKELMRLPELQRECVQLKAQGLRYHEIAEALEISMATAVDCVRRAVKRLGRRF